MIVAATVIAPNRIREKGQGTTLDPNDYRWVVGLVPGTKIITATTTTALVEAPDGSRHEFSDGSWDVPPAGEAVTGAGQKPGRSIKQQPRRHGKNTRLGIVGRGGPPQVGSMGKGSGKIVQIGTRGEVKPGGKKPIEGEK